MTQISRPFQIALVAIGLFAAVWFVALRGHSSSTGSSSSAAPASSASQASSSSPAAPTSPGSVYHGSAPGVAGLTRAIDKARGAVAQSQQNAHELQQKSAQASSNAPAHTSASGAGVTVVKVTRTTTTTHAGAKAAGAAGAASASSASATRAAAPKMQATVETELKQGKLVTILFWNPKASVDVKVRKELSALGHEQDGKIAVHDALANQVGSFGSFTRTVQVYGTPTILIVNKQGQTTSLTGLTDVFSLKQALAEAKSAH